MAFDTLSARRLPFGPSTTPPEVVAAERRREAQRAFHGDARLREEVHARAAREARGVAAAAHLLRHARCPLAKLLPTGDIEKRTLI